MLAHYGGAQERLSWRYADDRASIFCEVKGRQLQAPVIADALSHEDSVFLVLPIAYIHHDTFINPRPINLNLVNLVREFASGNPQLQQSLARIDDGHVHAFDGHHKTVARILLGEREILLRLPSGRSRSPMPDSIRVTNLKKLLS